MTEFGPVFDTDFLSWEFRRSATDIEPGKCEATAWELEESAEWDVAWDDAIEKTFPKPRMLWERIARAAIKRLGPLLATVRPNQPHASFAFAWFVPRYLASGAELTIHPLRFPDNFPSEDLVTVDQRLSRLLKCASLEGTDASGDA